MENYHFKLNNYQKQKPFSSFLSGVSGLKGIPLWAFYVNRGQLISSFGIRNKDGAIMEFFPANAAYHYVSRIGFRTFIKIDNKVYECFKEQGEYQTLDVYQDRVSITQNLEEEKISIKITYFTLPNERMAALVRKVEIINHSNDERQIEIVDGLAQILPTGVDYGGYKAISNLLQSWMQTKNKEEYVFYTLRGSTGDEAEVSEISEGNFVHSRSSIKPTYIYDYKALFLEDTSLEIPYAFINGDILEQKQTHVNQVPAAMVHYAFKLNKEFKFVSMFGYSETEDKLDEFVKKTNLNYFLNKESENKQIHDEITSTIKMKTNFPIYDAYLKQCYLDNVLRGGYPIQIEAKDKDATYYIYSRKHGDLERDYNFFNLEPAYYSQGNGNFRDVLQNRRNDLVFFPKIKAFNVLMFTSFIQDDGYNPLSIEGIEFIYEGDINNLDTELIKFIQNPFTPGKLLMVIEDLKLDESLFKTILAQSKVIYKASFGEGYWEDHFTYLLDLIEGFESIYPDFVEDLLFNQKVSIYQSNAYVVPRNQKYVMTHKKTIRQFGSVKHLDEMDHWLKENKKIIEIPVISKLLTLVLNKYAHLDPKGIGLSYEGNKPGWNDACNGIPGLFGSGVSETFELLKLVSYLRKNIEKYGDYELDILSDTKEFINKLNLINEQDDFRHWDQRMNALEAYRKNRLTRNTNISKVNSKEIFEITSKIETVLEKAVHKAKALSDIIPTYLTYEATSYDEIVDDNNQQVIGDYGLPLVNVHSFEMRALPSFLEGPARYLKNLAKPEEAKSIYDNVKQSGLYDKKHKFYQTSVSLEEESFEIGRLKAFTPGWLERESNFLHMTYKYLLGLLKSGLYDTFYEEIKTNYTCFMDPEVYGRSPIENSSFIVTSSNPDPKKHGQGFVSRLSGSTAEMLSMFSYMFYGKNLFKYLNGQLIFELNPKLNKEFFIDHKIETTLFKDIKLTYHNELLVNTYDEDAYIEKIVLTTKDQVIKFDQSFIEEKWAKDIRKKNVLKIDVYYNKEENK
ncbi:cellobiose phosphorylase [Mariniplasma anaerobium]|uniref:Cellobiose phosphorylase n=1 Tax=Mariniplasma anaerobium TaxID=2735436 RepID=A0A7U9XUQ1_9MOLU|nr:cellobiose phosphorylase [Mariniplasma anaerobium]BCR35788.1 hypothetical protein MPAN_006810 [Mariniplasma anaerobium]